MCYESVYDFYEEWAIEEYRCSYTSIQWWTKFFYEEILGFNQKLMKINKQHVAV